jgi:SAM-dependent methyltransferase
MRIEKIAERIQGPDGVIWRAEYRPCPTCRSQASKTLGERGGQAHREGKGVKTSVVQCVECGLLYTKPTLMPETNPYATETSDEYFQQHDYEHKILNGESMAAFAQSVLGAPGRMLEIGCGRGELMVGAAKKGWEVCGVEMTEEFARVAHAGGVNVEHSSVEDSKLLNETYDVIVMAAVLEHLYDPIRILNRVHGALRPGGLVFIDVPNELSLTMRVGNLYMRLRGHNWAVNLSPTFSPFHVVGFSPESLKRVLDSTGFRVHHFEVPRWNNSLPEAKNLMQKIERWSMDAVQTIGANLGMGDGISCWAVRV